MDVPASQGHRVSRRTILQATAGAALGAATTAVLPGATHLLYLARAVTPGKYRVPPPTVESMYRPNWQALGDAPEHLVVRGK